MKVLSAFSKVSAGLSVIGPVIGIVFDFLSYVVGGQPADFEREVDKIKVEISNLQTNMFSEFNRLDKTAHYIAL